MSDFTLKELKMLAKLEREMDAGEKLFVVDSSGNRWPVNPEIMTLLDLTPGQRVPAVVLSAIVEGHLAICKRELASTNAAT